jgi:hypothetical protein
MLKRFIPKDITAANGQKLRICPSAERGFISIYRRDAPDALMTRESTQKRYPGSKRGRG